MNTTKDRKSASKQSRREFYTADRMSHVRVSSKMYLCFLCSFVLIYFRMLFISYSNVANNNRPGHETSSKHVKIVWSIKNKNKTPCYRRKRRVKNNSNPSPVAYPGLFSRPNHLARFCLHHHSQADLCMCPDLGRQPPATGRPCVP